MYCCENVHAQPFLTSSAAVSTASTAVVTARNLLGQRRHSNKRSGGVLELRQFLECILAGARQHDLAARVVSLQRRVGYCHETLAKTQEPADLQDRKEHAIPPDDDVVDLAD